MGKEKYDFWSVDLLKELNIISALNYSSGVFI